MIPDNDSDFGSKKGATSPGISNEDYAAISQAFKLLEDLGVSSFTSLDSYIDWYRNVFGQLALEMFIEDCRKAVREKDYKKMLAIVAAMAANHRTSTSVTISVEDYADLEFEQPKVSDEFAEFTPAEIEQLLGEYEKYFDEIEIQELEVSEAKIALDEGGYISFSEITKLVSSFETRLAGLVVEGELTADQAKDLIAELKDIEVGKFSSLDKEELEAIVSELPNLDLEQVQALIENIDSRENVELDVTSKMFGEEGFLELGADAFSPLKSDAHLTFAEMEAKVLEFEAELISLVESGKITSDQAYAMKDAVDNAPIEEALVISEAATAILEREGLDTPAQIETAINQFLNSDYPTIIAETPQVQILETPSMAFDEAGFLSAGIRQDVSPAEGIESPLPGGPPPSLEMTDQLIVPDLTVSPDISESSDFAVGPDIATTFLQTIPTPVQRTATENFVPVKLFTTGTKPSEVPTFTPTQNFEATPNLVTQPKSFAKPEVPTQPQVQQPKQQGLQPTQPQVGQQPTQPQVGQQPTQPQVQQPAVTKQQQVQQQEPQHLKQEQPQPEQKVEPEVNEPKPDEHDYDKEPELDEDGCINCKKINCDDCGIKMESSHMDDALSALRSSRVEHSPISPPIVPDSFGSDFHMDIGARTIEPRTLSNSGMSR